MQNDDLNLTLDPDSGVPFYRQIADGIADRVAGGQLSPGDALPSVRVLARLLLVSVITTGRAYDALEADGVIVRRQGSGTFVAPGAAAHRRAAVREVERALASAVGRAVACGLDDAAVLRCVEASLVAARAAGGGDDG